MFHTPCVALYFYVIVRTWYVLCTGIGILDGMRDVEHVYG